MSRRPARCSRRCRAACSTAARACGSSRSARATRRCSSRRRALLVPGERSCVLHELVAVDQPGRREADQPVAVCRRRSRVAARSRCARSAVHLRPGTPRRAGTARRCRRAARPRPASARSGDGWLMPSGPKPVGGAEAGCRVEQRHDFVRARDAVALVLQIVAGHDLAHAEHPRDGRDRASGRACSPAGARRTRRADRRTEANRTGSTRGPRTDDP